MEIRIGFLVDPPAPNGRSPAVAADLAISRVNSEGGILIGDRRRPVVLVRRDIDGTPEDTTRATLELINQDKVVAIVGSSFSRNAIPSGEVAERAGIPMICPGSSHPKTTAGRRYVFRVAATDTFTGEALAHFAHRELDLETAAVLYDVADAYSRNMAEVFRQVFEQSGGRVVAFETFTLGDRDFRPQLERISATGPDALFLPNFRHEVVLQSEQARQMGLDAVLLGASGWPVGDELDTFPSLEGAYSVRNWHRDMAPADPESEHFIVGYRELTGREADSLAALTYDAFGLIFEAIAVSSRIDPGAIRDALAEIEDHPGLTGPITYRGLGGDPSKQVAIVKFLEGDVELSSLAPPAISAGEPPDDDTLR